MVTLAQLYVVMGAMAMGIIFGVVLSRRKCKACGDKFKEKYCSFCR